ncbi:unnamed protein product [Fraxinus pennsylvanica]|uniref:Uncharacterized protein n=1 Tax=Fraxinus pennsylvanica TaxID=56036 RepID=A0AAD2DRQ7_9LAMI|nr:unnamed protein product [Fraxinus pennsylvanica]
MSTPNVKSVMSIWTQEMEQRMEFTKELEQNCLISSVTTYTELLDLQKQLFKSQIQQLKYLVKTHRELTGVNPLSPEMVAGRLSIKTDIVKVLPDLEELDKHFIDEKIALMKKEKSFSGQVKLMESILQIENPSVLSWLLIKGGMMILATWLSQAAMEEQTSVLNIILKVLHILPLQMAFLAQKTIIYKIVTKLQFYWTPGLDISKSARTLLTKWSNMSAKSQDSKDGKSQSVLLYETRDPREVQMVENPDQSTTLKIPKLDPHQEYIVLSDSDDEAPQQEGRNQVPDFIPEHLIKYWHFVADPRNWRDQKNRSSKSTRLIQGQEASGEGSSSKNDMAGEDWIMDLDLGLVDGVLEFWARARACLSLIMRLKYYKQTQLETIATEKAAAEFKLEKEVKRLQEAQLEPERGRASRRASSSCEEDADMEALEYGSVIGIEFPGRLNSIRPRDSSSPAIEVSSETMISSCSRFFTKAIFVNTKPNLLTYPAFFLSRNLSIHLHQVSAVASESVSSSAFKKIQIQRDDAVSAVASESVSSSAFKKIQIQRDDAAFDAYVIGKEDAPGIVVLHE